MENGTGWILISAIQLGQAGRVRFGSGPVPFSLSKNVPFRSSSVRVDSCHPWFISSGVGPILDSAAFSIIGPAVLISLDSCLGSCVSFQGA